MPARNSSRGNLRLGFRPSVALHQFHVAIISHMELDAIVGIIDTVIGRLQQLRSLFTGHRAPLEYQFPPCRAGTLDSGTQKDTRGRSGERQNSAKGKMSGKGEIGKAKGTADGDRSCRLHRAQNRLWPY
jgi:hypothetical protein